MLRRATRLIFAALTAWPLAAQGQTAPASDDIVIVGTGLSLPPGTPAYGSTVIDRDRLANDASGRIEDVLSDVAGFQQFRRSDSRSANPSAQGATLRALGGNASSRTLILLDGVPIADPFFGYIPFSALVARPPVGDPRHARRRVGRVRGGRGRRHHRAGQRGTQRLAGSRRRGVLRQPQFAKCLRQPVAEPGWRVRDAVRAVRARRRVPDDARRPARGRERACALSRLVGGCARGDAGRRDRRIASARVAVRRQPHVALPRRGFEFRGRRMRAFASSRAGGGRSMRWPISRRATSPTR